MMGLYLRRLQGRRLWRHPGLRLLMLAVMLAVTALSSVGLFADRVERGLVAQGAALLAADLVVEQGRELPDAWRQQALRLGLQTARVMTFPSVLVHRGKSALVQVKAVESGYPLRGSLRLRAGAVPRGAAPVSGELFGEARIERQFALQAGDAVPVGDLQLVWRGRVEQEPDRAASLFQLAPRLLISWQDAGRSGLVGPGSRVKYRLLLAGEERALRQFRAWLEPQLTAHTRLLDADSGRPELTSAIERGRRFLSLAALCASLLAGVAIMLATRRHLVGALDSAAVLRTMGMPGSRVLALHLLELLAAALLASLAGVLLAYLLQAALLALLADLFTLSLPPPGWRSLLLGPVFGLVLVTGFSLPSIWAIRKVPPLRVLRRELNPPSLSDWLIGLLAALSFVALIFWQARDVRLAAWISGGLLTSLLALALLARLLLWGLRRRPRSLGAVGYAMGALLRQPRLTLLQLCGFGFAITLLLLLSLVRVDLIETWQRSLQPGTPNHFLINVQPQQREPLRDWLGGQGVDAGELYATTRARLMEVNGRALQPQQYASARARRLASREYSLGFAAAMQTDNRILQGDWWHDRQRAEQPGLSLEQGMADELGIRLGDQLLLEAGGITLHAPVTSIRSVAWDSFNVNFFIVASPGLQRQVPVSYLASLYLDDAQSDLVLALAERFPGVSVLDLRPLLQQVRRVMDQGALAIEGVFLFTLLAAALVTLTAVQVSRDQRAREIAVLRTLGASRALLQGAALAEFALLGLLAGIMAALFANAISYALALRLFDLPGQLNPQIWLFGCVGGMLVVGLIGLAATRGLVRTPPVLVLQRLAN